MYSYTFFHKIYFEIWQYFSYLWDKSGRRVPQLKCLLYVIFLYGLTSYLPTKAIFTMSEISFCRKGLYLKQVLKQEAKLLVWPLVTYNFYKMYILSLFQGSWRNSSSNSVLTIISPLKLNQKVTEWNTR